MRWWSNLAALSISPNPGSNPSIPSPSPHRLSLPGRVFISADLPYFNQRRIKSGSATNIGQRLRGQRIHVSPTGRQLVPVQPRGHYTLRDLRIDQRLQRNAPASIEDLDLI